MASPQSTVTLFRKATVWLVLRTVVSFTGRKTGVFAGGGKVVLVR